jgi:23S rRNA (guanosine2251-2'-O)-methyltransferase
MSEILYGRNAARECLRARRRHIYKVIVYENIQASANVREILALAKQSKIVVEYVPRKKLHNLAKGHQGMALEVGRYPTFTIEEVLRRAAKLNESPFIMALDHIEDPHNLGAILRTAEAVGVHGVLIPKQRAVGITPAVVNASAGAVEHMRVVEIPNLVQVLKKLKSQNIWIAGVENMPTALSYTDANLAGPLALVIGGEGQGLSRLVKDTCDFLVKLPMRGQIESLNASVAGGLLLYEVWRARGFQ